MKFLSFKYDCFKKKVMIIDDLKSKMILCFPALFTNSRPISLGPRQCHPNQAGTPGLCQQVSPDGRIGGPDLWFFAFEISMSTILWNEVSFKRPMCMWNGMAYGLRCVWLKCWHSILVLRTDEWPVDLCAQRNHGSFSPQSTHVCGMYCFIISHYKYT